MSDRDEFDVCPDKKYRIEILVHECNSLTTREGNVFNTHEDASAVAELLRTSRRVMCLDMTKKRKK